MSSRFRGRFVKAIVSAALIICLFAQSLTSFAAGANVGSEFDLSRLFYSVFKVDSGGSVLNQGGINLSLTGAGNIAQTKALLISESAYSSLKAFLPYNFSIDYFFYSDGLTKANLKIEQPSSLKSAVTAAQRVFSKIITPKMSDLEKVRAIHDYIVLNCEYDYPAMSSYRFASYSFYGVFINKKAVCSGYADAFQLLCTMAGIPSLIVCGDASNGMQTIAHSWNMVHIDGRWMYVDVTFDDPYPDRKGAVIHDYFLIDYAAISTDHFFDEVFYLTLAEHLSVVGIQSAGKLEKLGLFKGTSKGFDLDRRPTRAEAAVMLVRLLGREQEALDPANGYAEASPFTDLPDWAAGHIGYLYVNGITTGVSETKFGSASAISLNQYLAFLLRALGYSDGYDFNWNEAEKFAKELGLVSQYKILAVSRNSFYRSDLADISLIALNQYYKNQSETLFERLLSDGAFSPEQAMSGGFIA